MTPDPRPIAIAVFVKTPGLSPVKTRLARGIGTERAIALYERSVDAVAAVVGEAAWRAGGAFAPYWAVAEPEGLDVARWRAFPRVAQGDGDLGARLGHVYASLLADHAGVLLLGADCPQLGAALLGDAAAALRGASDFVLGPARDGGFYLFGGRLKVAASDWRAVPYSSADTAAVLTRTLAPHGSWRTLEPHSDLDEETDVAVVAKELRAAAAALLPAQRRLLAELEALGGGALP